MEESKRRKEKSFSKERKKAEVEEEFETRGEEESKKPKKRKLKNMDDVNIDNEEIGYKEKKKKRKINTCRAGNDEERINHENQEIEDKKKKKTKDDKNHDKVLRKFVEKSTVEEQEIDEKKKKKKKKGNNAEKGREIMSDKSQELEDKKRKIKNENKNIDCQEIETKIKKQKSKKFKSKEDTTLHFVSHDSNEGFKNITVDENGDLNDDMTEKFKSRSQVKSRKAKRNEHQSLSRNDETLVDDSNALVKIKKKENGKKSEKVIADTESNDASDKKNSGDEALLYLKMWKNDRANWTFKKVRQVWLLKHMFDQSKVPDDYFDMLLLYLEGLQGMARKTTISRAEGLLESGGDEQNHEEFNLERVKKLLQILN